MARGHLFACWITAFALLSRPVHADVDAQRRATAEVLFNEAKALYADGKYSDACPKFEESQRVDPALNTAFRVADCHEKLGLFATAWAEFLGLAGDAERASEKRLAEEAKKRQTALEPKLARLKLVVPAALASTVGLVIERDGMALGKAAWGTAFPVDPGKHRVIAKAPGKRPLSIEVVAPPSPGVVEATLAPLDDLPSDKPPPIPSDKPPPKPSVDAPVKPQPSAPVGMRVAAGVVGGLGLVGLGMGVGFGAFALQKRAAWDDAVSASGVCPNRACPTQSALSDVQRIEGARDSAATISTASFVVGGAAAATSILLGVLSRGGAAPQSAVIVPSFGKGTFGLTVGGAL